MDGRKGEVMRKILYSPGYGAGWTSWCHGPKEEKLFMLEYKPFIEIIENGNEITEKDIERFNDDFREKFPEAEFDPYTGGVEQLQVYETDGVVRIEEYDGSESVHESYDDWM